ncbi:MAG: AAA family ATPase [Spirochaetaceae bacterium]|nr:AAA family ATPase [Spirochaetaceae bacterium]MDE0447076.1 AAA family ATPase [Spirochaetaceae bacterium]
MDVVPIHPRIPYGQSDFRRIRLNRWLYVDKTRFLRRLEREDYVFLIRPRRFGKSLWVSLLENYYDRWWGHEFDATFAGTDIGRNPTAEHHRYVVLRFDFSMVNDKLETLEREFETYCMIELRGTLERHPDLFPETARQRILAPPSIATKLSMLFRYAGDHGIPLYVLIDEYDNFANTVLARHGAQAYEDFTHGGGFYRNFFATLKGGTARSGGGIDRLFITGVSPVTMDDVTSGFNIGTNISLEPDFNEMVGFTEAEVRRLVETYREHGVLDQDVDEAMALMGEWYNGYRFAAEDADTDVYNTDMVLYYLKHSMPNRGVPRYLIDTNVRIDYGKLRHLLVVGRQLNGNFDLLREVIGEGRKDLPHIQPSFPLQQLTDRQNFLSLLHYFGLLSIRGVVDGMPRLAIPNQTVKQLMYGYLRDGYRDVAVFRVDLYRFEQLMMRMANQGEWRPPFAFLAEAIAAQTGIRDYIAGEKVVQGFLAAYLSVTDFYVFRSEAELGKGHADISLEPLLARFPHLRHGYLIELKYLKRSESADRDAVAAAVRDATTQLARYLADERLARQFPGVRFTGLALVFHGWELAYCDAVS